MKKIGTILVIILLNISVANAKEVIHGIDIDEVYNNGDWSSRDKIKEIIDDYTLLQLYKLNLIKCAESTEKLNCQNQTLNNIIKHFYSYNAESNIQIYKNYINTINSVYEIAYCQNKYSIPPGTGCLQEASAKTEKILQQYIEFLLLQIEQKISVYNFIKNYK